MGARWDEPTPHWAIVGTDDALGAVAWLPPSGGVAGLPRGKFFKRRGTLLNSLQEAITSTGRLVESAKNPSEVLMKWVLHQGEYV